MYGCIIYVYIYVCVSIYIHIYVCVRMYVCMYVCIYTHTYYIYVCYS